MRKTHMFLAFAFLALSTRVPSAGAITNGQPDGTLHPAVGALVGYVPQAGRTVAYCSGTLISPTVVLTAAHCGFLATPTVQMTFDPAYTTSSRLYAGTFRAHPDFKTGSNTQGPTVPDIAVVVFQDPIRRITPARLPTAGLLDQMKAAGTLRDAQFTAVGYGDTEFVNGAGGKTTTHPQARNYSVGSFNSLTTGYLHLSQQSKKGEGGTCNGDSGGPNFVGAASTETDVIASITATGDTYCSATNVGYRPDTQTARTFLADYVTLP